MTNPEKTIGLIELAKRCGLYKFKCNHCGGENKGIVALKSIFELILFEVSKTNTVKIIGFGSFSLKRWRAPKTKITKNIGFINRLCFRPSKTAKQKMIENVKEN